MRYEGSVRRGNARFGIATAMRWKTHDQRSYASSLSLVPTILIVASENAQEFPPISEDHQHFLCLVSSDSTPCVGKGQLTVHEVYQRPGCRERDEGVHLGLLLPAEIGETSGEKLEDAVGGSKSVPLVLRRLLRVARVVLCCIWRSVVDIESPPLNDTRLRRYQCSWTNVYLIDRKLISLVGVSIWHAAHGEEKRRTHPSRFQLATKIEAVQVSVYTYCSLLLLHPSSILKAPLSPCPEPSRVSRLPSSGARLRNFQLRRQNT